MDKSNRYSRSIHTTRYYCSLLFAFFVIYQTHAQQIHIKGFIFSEDKNEALAFVNILQNPSGQRTHTNKFGAFSILARASDTLEISMIGYQTKKILIKDFAIHPSDTIVKIYLQARVYSLNRFDVNRNKYRNDSLAKHFATILKTDSLLNNYSKIKYWPKSTQFVVSPIGIGCTGCITAIWFRYSKRGQEITKTLRLIDHYKVLQKIDEKFNKDFIQKITGLEGVLLDVFMKHCKLPDQFILDASEYDLGIATKNCLVSFKQ